MAQGNQGNQGGNKGNQGNQGGNKGNQGGTSNRGFASMDPEEQREIASKGGKAAHEQGVAHEFTSEEAREAGRKGGQASGGGRSNASNSGGKSERGFAAMDEDEQKEISRKGGESSRGGGRSGGSR